MEKRAFTPQARGQRIDERQFRFRLAIETVDAVGERVLDFGGGLSDA